MQVLNELAVDDDDALAGRLGRRMRLNDPPGEGELIVARREGRVGAVDRLGVDERLAVKAEGAACSPASDRR